MYQYLKHKFNLTELKVNELIARNKGSEELFQDYESICSQQAELVGNREITVLNEELIDLLESEILALLLKGSRERE